MKCLLKFVLIGALGFWVTSAAAQDVVPDPTVSELSPGSAQLISPEALVKLLKATAGEKPLILNVGPSLLYQQAHIPDSEYIGPGSDPQALERLRTRVKALPHKKFIVLYCGCCPWSHCPNVRPAYSELHALGFTQVKVLY
ncbi:MAG: rhodanese-like domain-containing protein, partial [Candidatus Korobacteraceae bacterium]